MTRILTLAILLLPSILWANAKPLVHGKFMPDPQAFISEAVYVSSNTCANGNNLVISDHPSLLYAIVITTVSGPGGTVQAFDHKTTGSGRDLTPLIQTSSFGSVPFNVGASSGIVINKSGGGCISVIHLER